MIRKGDLFFPTGVASGDHRSCGNFFVVLGVDNEEALLAGTNAPPNRRLLDTIGCCTECDIKCCVIGADAGNYPFRYSVLLERQNMNVWKCGELKMKGLVPYKLSATQMQELEACAKRCRSIPKALLARFL